MATESGIEGNGAVACLTELISSFTVGHLLCYFAGLVCVHIGIGYCLLGKF